MKYQNYSGIPKRGYPLSAIPTFGIPGIIPADPIPPPPYDGGGGGGGGMDIRAYEMLEKLKLKEKILRDDQEIMEFISTIIPFLN